MTAKIEKQRKALLAALDAAVMSLREIAEAGGISEDSLYFYRLDRSSPNARSPSPQTITALTKVLEKHHRQLERAIKRLRSTTEG